MNELIQNYRDRITYLKKTNKPYKYAVIAELEAVISDLLIVSENVKN